MPGFVISESVFRKFLSNGKKRTRKRIYRIIEKKGDYFLLLNS
ncbi:hypothetical protein LEP1GSC052_0172 [Leptospira kmetyi serovar Malaysia str. Bejo-Iso9]|nr:hypothetical protein LEP1GSC052_0172 [Leptospira kmetyi serovar Malaysia str. Bejo-Iso9]